MHRAVDPALAEWSASRAFRFSVYPIPAKGEKRVFIAYDQELTTADYELDLRYGRVLDSADVIVDADGRTVESIHARGETLDRAMRVTRDPRETALVARSPEDGYWYASATIDVRSAERRMPPAAHVVILCDTSSSSVQQKAMSLPVVAELRASDVVPQRVLFADAMRIHVADRSRQPMPVLPLHVTIGGQSGAQRDIALRELHEAREASMVRRAWARAKLRQMLAGGAGDDELIAHGRAFTQLTPRTSLLVLESWHDYARYDIPMPPDVLAEKQRDEEKQRRALERRNAPPPPPLMTPGSWIMAGRVLEREPQSHFSRCYHFSSGSKTLASIFDSTQKTGYRARVAERRERRYLAAQIREDLQRKMVFVAGPRQVGKTTMALAIPGARRGYLNWDISEHRERILRNELPPGKLWVFDELHKYRRWRNYLKGIYDGRPEGQQILVTGSGRLDLYRFGGDSLQGRYHLLHLHPFSVAEQRIHDRDGFDQLLRLGGFPEPFLSGSDVEARRWSREYRTRLIREDVASLERIQDLGHLELLMIRLPELVGSPLSLNALREDLQVSHKTVSSWIQALERLYAVFRLAPFGAPRIRAVKKEQKHYHFDWSIVPNDAARFENMVASHLLKWAHFEQDTKGRDLDLCYFRDVDGREVDFVVSERNKLLLMVECKWDDAPIDRSLRYLKSKFATAEAWQISARGTKDYQSAEGIRVAHARTLLARLV